MIQINRGLCPNSSALASGNYKHTDNKDALIQSNFGKCMYCESNITHIDYGDVEHIKPKSKYPQLKFDWENLGYSCTKCNRQFKNDNYDETTPFLDPYSDNPSEYLIATGALLFPKHGSERGDITITGLGLNRPSLIEKRLEKLNEIDKVIKSCYRTNNVTLRNNAINELKKEANNDKEYSFIVKSLFILQEIA